MQLNFEKYWDFLDDNIDKLFEDGYVRFPSIDSFDLKYYGNLISKEIGEQTFSELCNEHQIFIDKLSLNKHLTPKLYKIANKEFGYSGLITNQYHVARRVVPGNSTEKYRAHFDSHIFTLVIPIEIPKVIDNGDTIGELVFFPNLRRFPRNPIEDFLGKLWFHKYSNQNGIKKLNQKYPMVKNSFELYEPLLFFGNTVFHTNLPVSENADSYRLTLLAHFFDPFPKYGVGNLLRKVRKR